MAENVKVSNEDSEISLKELIIKIKELFHYLLKKWRIIVLFGVLGASLGLVKSLLTDTEYVARLSFAVQEKGSSGGGLAALAGQFGVNVGGGTESVFSGSNVIELLKSRNLIEKTLLSKTIIENKDDRLLNHYIDRNGVKEEWEKSNKEIISFPLNQKRDDFSRAQDSTLAMFISGVVNKKLSISKVSKETSIIEVKFTNKDELFAKYFTSILVKEVTDFYVQSRTEVPRSNLMKMGMVADSVKRELELYMMKRAVYADRNLDAVRQITGVEQQKDQIKIQMLGTVYAEMTKNIEALKMDIIRETPLVQIIDTPILPLEKQRLGKMKAMLIGGFLGGFIVVSYLLAALFYRRIMSEGNDVTP